MAVARQSAKVGVRQVLEPEKWGEASRVSVGLTRSRRVPRVWSRQRMPHDVVEEVLHGVGSGYV